MSWHGVLPGPTGRGSRQRDFPRFGFGKGLIWLCSQCCQCCHLKVHYVHYAHLTLYVNICHMFASKICIKHFIADCPWLCGSLWIFVDLCRPKVDEREAEMDRRGLHPGGGYCGVVEMTWNDWRKQKEKLETIGNIFKHLQTVHYPQEVRALWSGVATALMGDFRCFNMFQNVF